MSKLLQALLTQNNLIVSKEDLELSAQEGTLEPTPDPTPESQELKQPEGQPEGLVALTDGADENSPVAAAEPTIEPAAELQPEVQPEVPAEGVMAPADSEQAPVVGEPAPEVATDVSADTVVTEPSLEDLEAIEDHHAALVEAHEEHAAEVSTVSEAIDTLGELSESHNQLEMLLTEATEPENAEAGAEIIEAQLSPEIKDCLESAIATECRILGIPTFGIESLRDHVKVVGKAVSEALKSAWKALVNFIENLRVKMASFIGKDVAIPAGAVVKCTNRVIIAGTNGTGKLAALKAGIEKDFQSAEALLTLLKGTHSPEQVKSTLDKHGWKNREEEDNKTKLPESVEVTKEDFDQHGKDALLAAEKAQNIIARATKNESAEALAESLGNDVALAHAVISSLRSYAWDMWDIFSAVQALRHQLVRAGSAKNDKK